MTLQDVRHPNSIELSECGRSLCEGSVARGKHSQIRGLVHGGHQAGFDQQFGKGCQAQRNCGSRDSCRNSQNFVDDVDNAAGELDVLFSLSICHFRKKSTPFDAASTYRGGHLRCLLEARNNDNA